MPEVSSEQPRWLLLVHQLPARPSNLRVHIWRRLQQIGAISLRNSIYVLPNTPETREDFEWIRAEISDRSGRVSIFAADVVDGYTDEELRRSFLAARAADYQVLLRRVKALSGQRRRKQSHRDRTRQRRDCGKLREQWAAIKAIDFFGAPSAAEAQKVIDDLEQTLGDQRVDVATDRRDPRFYRGRVWLTRPHPGIDRMASAWLIRRFITTEATFVFGALPAADGQIPFDMPHVEFGHHGSLCTFETLIERFGIQDVAAKRIGQIVHDLDLKESRYDLPDTATIGRLVQGLRDSGSEDGVLLNDGIRLIEALYQSLVRHSNTTTNAGALGRRRRRASPISAAGNRSQR